MGFSKGAIPSLYASMNRFQNAYAPEGASFAAYIGFYTPCNIALIDDEKVSAKPIRLYHGIADDWVPIGPCRDYVARLKRAGADVDLVEYPGASHAFDDQTIPGTCQLPQAQTGRVRARMPGERAARTVPLYDRDALLAGNRVPGPAIVHQLDATTLVLAGQRARIDTRGSLWLEEAR